MTDDTDLEIGTQAHTGEDEPHHTTTLSDALWTFQARPDPNSPYDTGVVDGDTYHILLDQGFRTHRAESLRAWHLDTAELRGDSLEKGREHRQFAIDWISDAVSQHDGQWPLIVHTGQSTGAYGRWLCMVFDHRGNSLEADLIDEFGPDYLRDDASEDELHHRFMDQ